MDASYGFMADGNSVVCSSSSFKLDDLEYPIHKHAFNGDKRKIKRCLKEGFDINFPNSNGFTPLYLSALGGHKKSSKYLIKMGADPNKRTFDGLTSLHAAAQFGDAELLDALIAAGGDIRLHDYGLHDVLDFAKQNKNSKSRNGITRLIQCATHGAVNRPQVDYLETTATFNKRQKGKQFSFSNLFGKKSHGLGNCTVIADGFGKVVVQRDEKCSLLKSYPVATVNDLDHDDDGYTWENGPHFVMEGMLWNGEPVTVKKLHTKPKKLTCIDLIIEELNNVLKLQNNSIITLIGASRDYFAANQKNALSYDQSAVVMRQISSALNYLHRTRFVHCSVTSHAIFLTSNYQAKLGNFEYMTSFESQQPCLVISNRFLNSVYNWMAPEVMEGQRPTSASDVYGFSSVFWEATQGRIPWASVPCDLIFDKVVNGKWSCLAYEAVNSQNTVMVPEKFLDIISSGMQHNPLSRMSLSKIERILCKYIEDNSCCPPIFEKPAHDKLNTFSASLWGDVDDGAPSTSPNLQYPEDPSFSFGVRRHSGPKCFYGKREKLVNSHSSRNKTEDKPSKFVDTIGFKSSSLDGPTGKSVQDFKRAFSHPLNLGGGGGLRLVNKTFRSLGEVDSCQQLTECKPTTLEKGKCTNASVPNLTDESCPESAKKTINSVPVTNHGVGVIEQLSRFDRRSVSNMEGSKELEVDGSGSMCAGVNRNEMVKPSEKSAEDTTNASMNNSANMATAKEIDDRVLQAMEGSPKLGFENSVRFDRSIDKIEKVKLDSKVAHKECLSQSYKIDFLKIEGVSTYGEISDGFKGMPEFKVTEKSCRIDKLSRPFQSGIPSDSGSAPSASNYRSRKSFFGSSLGSIKEKYPVLESSSRLKMELRCVGLPRPYKKKINVEATRDLKEETEVLLNNSKTVENAESYKSRFSRNEIRSTTKSKEVKVTSISPSNVDRECRDAELLNKEERAGTSDGFTKLNISCEDHSKIEDNFCVRESTIQDQNSPGFHPNFLNYLENVERSFNVKCGSELGPEINGERGRDGSSLPVDETIGNSRRSFTCNHSVNKVDDVEMTSFSRSVQQFSFNGRRLIPSRSLNRQCQLPAVGVKPASHIINAKVLKPLASSFSPTERHTCHETDMHLNTSIREIIKSYEEKITNSFRQPSACEKMFPGYCGESPNSCLADPNLIRTGTWKDSFSLSSPRPESKRCERHSRGDEAEEEEEIPKSDVVHISGLKIYVGGGDGVKSAEYGTKLFNLPESLMDARWHDDDAGEFV